MIAACFLVAGQPARAINNEQANGKITGASGDPLQAPVVAVIGRPVELLTVLIAACACPKLASWHKTEHSIMPP